MTNRDTIAEPAGQVPMCRRADLVVVGGGPAGIAAAVAGARSGSRSRFSNATLTSAVSPRAAWSWCSTTCGTARRSRCVASAWRWSSGWSGSASPSSRLKRRAPFGRSAAIGRAGARSTSTQEKPQPICYAAAFDPDAFKRASNGMSANRDRARLHSWFSRALVEDGSSRASSARPRAATRRSSARSWSTPAATSTSPRPPARHTSAAATSSPPYSGSAESTPPRPSGSNTRSRARSEAIDGRSRRSSAADGPTGG